MHTKFDFLFARSGGFQPGKVYLWYVTFSVTRGAFSAAFPDGELRPKRSSGSLGARSPRPGLVRLLSLRWAGAALNTEHRKCPPRGRVPACAPTGNYYCAGAQEREIIPFNLKVSLSHAFPAAGGGLSVQARTLAYRVLGGSAWRHGHPVPSRTSGCFSLSIAPHSASSPQPPLDRECSSLRSWKGRRQVRRCAVPAAPVVRVSGALQLSWWGRDSRESPPQSRALGRRCWCSAWLCSSSRAQLPWR